MSAAFVTTLRTALASGVRIVLVVTHEEERLRALLRQTFGDARIATWASTTGVDGDRKFGNPERAIEHAGAFETPKVWVLQDLHPYLHEPRIVRALRDFCTTPHAGVIVLVSPVESVPMELEREVAVLPLPLPAATELGALLASEIGGRAATGAKPPEIDHAAFVRAGLGLTLDEARRAFRVALAGDPAEALRTIVAEKRHALRRSSTLELVDTDVTLDDVGGLEALKAWLKMRVLAFDAGARAFGLDEPRGMLVCGVQGCGKSLVSKAAARVLGLPLVRLDFAEVFAAGSPEHAIHEATRAVEAVAPVVLWVDEIEKGLGAEAADARHARVFGAFLTWLQERRAPVFVAATANEVDRLPPELARRGRFDEVFFVDLPSGNERGQILAVHLRRRGRDARAYPVEELARDLEHWSGAEIEQMVTSGLFRAYAEKTELTEEHLRAAARELIPLATLYEEKVQALRQWGQSRARRASADRRTLDLFDAEN